VIPARWNDRREHTDCSGGNRRRRLAEALSLPDGFAHRRAPQKRGALPSRVRINRRRVCGDLDQAAPLERFERGGEGGAVHAEKR
jgi:hypothetical protein